GIDARQAIHNGLRSVVERLAWLTYDVDHLTWRGPLDRAAPGRLLFVGGAIGIAELELPAAGCMGSVAGRNAIFVLLENLVPFGVESRRPTVRDPTVCLNAGRIADIDHFERYAQVVHHDLKALSDAFHGRPKIGLTDAVGQAILGFEFLQEGRNTQAARCA